MAFSRMKQNFIMKLDEIVNDLQPRLAGNKAGTENLFKARVSKLIVEMNAELTSEIRRNKDGNRFEFVKVKFKDGATVNLPTVRRLHVPVERNAYAEEMATAIAEVVAENRNA